MARGEWGALGGSQPAVFLLLLLMSQWGHGQIQSLRQKRQQPSNMPMITGLDVTCEKSGMTVNLQFSAPFNGVVFSKGHFSNPACRYIEPGGGSDKYTFVVATNECGTQITSSRRTDISGAENIIIVQMDPLVQEIWDSARRISCQWEDTYRKSIRFQPFSVGMLAVEQGEDTSNVNCWMDIRKGRFPETRPLEGITKIGEPLSILIFLSDQGERRFNVKAQDCWAYDSEYFEDSTTTKVQLTTRDGCPVKEKLIGGWQKTRQVPKTGVKSDGQADLILYNIVNAFKFPDNAQVYITCNVEICRGECDNVCEAPTTTTRTTLVTARPFLLGGDPRQPKFLVEDEDEEDTSSSHRPPTFVQNPSTLATTPKTSFEEETTRHTTVKAISLVDFGKVDVQTRRPGILANEGGGGTTRHQGVEALTKSPPSPFANTRFPSPDFKSPFPPTVPPEQRPLPFSPSPFSIKQTSKQTPFQARNPPQLPLIPTSLQVPSNLPSASRLPKVSPLFQGPNLRNPGIKGTGSLNSGFQDPGSLVPGLTSLGLNDPGALVPPGSISRPIFPGKQSVPFRPSPALAGAMFRPVSPMSAASPRPPTSMGSSMNCFPGVLNPRCHHHEACRRVPNHPECKSYERCRMLERRPNCSRIVCKISPFSSECTRSRQPKVVGDNLGRLPKLARPCDPSRPNCNLGNFFPRPPDVFKMVPGGFKVIPGGFRPQKTQENQISFCKDGTLDPWCRPRSRLPAATKPGQGVETPTIPRPVTEQPIKTSHENTPPPAQSQGPQNTNGISNGPLNSFNPTLSPGPIKNNIVTPFKAGNKEKNSPPARAPKQLGGGTEEVDLPCNGLDSRGECTSKVGEKSEDGCKSDVHGCDQRQPEATSQRSPVFGKPDPKEEESSQRTVVPTFPNLDAFSAHPSSTPDPNVFRTSSEAFPAFPASFTEPPSNRLRDPTTLSTDVLPDKSPEIEDQVTSDQNGSFVDPKAKTDESGARKKGLPTTSEEPNLHKEVAVLQRPTALPHPSKTAGTPSLPDQSPPTGKSTPFDLKPVRVPLTSLQSFSPTGQLPSSFSFPTPSPSLKPGEPSPVSHQEENPGVVIECREKEGGCSDPKLADVDETECSDSSCQGPHQEAVVPASDDPIKIDNHDCPPGSHRCSATVPPKMKDAGVMNSQVTASPPPPSNGLELGKTPNVVPSPRSQVPPTSTSRTPRLNLEAGRGKAGGASPLPTPSSPPSKANQAGMLNGANQERPRIPQISLDAGHPRPRPVGSGPLGRPAQEKQSPTGGPEVPDPGRPHQLAPCAAIPGGPDNSCPQELPRKPKSEDIGKRLPTETRENCEPGSLAEECWPEDPCAEGDPNCWPFDFSRETARTCLANSDTQECQAFALAYQRYCNSHPVSRLCVGRNTDPAPAAGRQPSRPGSGVTSSRPPIECSADSRDPICRFLPNPAALSPSQPQTPAPIASLQPQRPGGEDPRKSDRKKLFNLGPKKAPGGPVKTGKVKEAVNPNRSRKPSAGTVLGRGGRTESDPERKKGEGNPRRGKGLERELGSQLGGGVTGRGAGEGGQPHKQQERPGAALPEESTKSEERRIGLLPKKEKKKPFLAFRKQPNLSLPSTARKPLEGSTGRQPGRPGRKKSEDGGQQEKQESDIPRQGAPLARQPKQRNPQGSPLARQPKQGDPEDEDDQEEPAAEPEPSHHKGDPRTHPFHSWLYQKIDPKVREARRKKFFGSGRRKRDTGEEDEGNMEEQGNLEEDLLLEVFGSKDLEEGGQNSDASRKGRADGSPPNSQSRFHAFHSWLHLPIDPVLGKARREKLWRQHHGHHKEEIRSMTKRAAGEGISINLGVKRITIQDSVGDMLQHQKGTATESQHLRGDAFGQTDLPSLNTIIAFSIFTLMVFLILTFGASIVTGRRPLQSFVRKM